MKVVHVMIIALRADKNEWFASSLTKWVDFKMGNCECLSVENSQCEHSNEDQIATRTNHNTSRVFLRGGPSYVPRHTAGRRAVHLPRRVKVHVDRPVGGDADRLWRLHVRRRDAAGPRETSSLRHSGGWSFLVGAAKRETRSSLASRGACSSFSGA